MKYFIICPGWSNIMTGLGVKCLILRLKFKHLAFKIKRKVFGLELNL